MMPCGMNSDGVRGVVFGIFPVREVVADAACRGRPVLVEGGNRQQVGNVDACDEVARLRDQLPSARAIVPALSAAWLFGSIGVAMPPTRKLCRCGFLPPRTACSLMNSRCQSSASR